MQSCGPCWSAAGSWEWGSSSRSVSLMRTREGRMIGVGPLAGGSDRRSEAEILRRIRRRPRPRISSLILVGLAIAGLSALYLFADSLGALWRAETGSQEKASELAETRQALALAHREIDTASRDRSAALADLAAVTQAKRLEQEALVLERERAERAERDLAWAHNELEVLKADRARAPPSTAAERLKRDLMAARREVEALKAEGAKALAASRDAVRAAEAKGVEQQEALVRERAEAERLNRDLAATRSEIEGLRTAGAPALAVSAEAAAQANAAEREAALSRGEAERLNRDLATARREIQVLKAESARTLEAS